MIPKFRCFDKDTKTMHEVVSIDFRDWRVYYEAYGLRNYWNKNVVLMQSTGLHDKNGVEIYEGDIVNSMNKKFRIIFDDAEFMAGGINIRLKKIVSHMEVIGNIYENPELMEV